MSYTNVKAPLGTSSVSGGSIPSIIELWAEVLKALKENAIPPLHVLRQLRAALYQETMDNDRSAKIAIDLGENENASGAIAINESRAWESLWQWMAGLSPDEDEIAEGAGQEIAVQPEPQESPAASAVPEFVPVEKAQSLSAAPDGSAEAQAIARHAKWFATKAPTLSLPIVTTGSPPPSVPDKEGIVINPEAYEETERAITAGGEITWDLKLYNGSPTLRSIGDEYLGDPSTLIEELVRLRPVIFEELGAVAGVSRSYSLATLVSALGAGGRIAKDSQTYERFASARDLYYASPLLQGIDDSYLQSPELLIPKLAEIRPDIEKEQDVNNYALCTLVQALAAGGRLSQKNRQSFMRLATARDLYDSSPLLQSIGAPYLRSPELLIPKLVELRPSIEKEQNVKHYSLHTFAHALVTGGKISKSSQLYERLAGARDLYDSSPLLQGIDDSYLQSPETLIPKLVELRPDIKKEQQSQGYALATLVRALVVGRRITMNIYSFVHLATARDLYDRSPTLQNNSNENLQDDESIVRYLLTYRDRIAYETSKDKDIEGTKDIHAIDTLVKALYAGGRVNKKRYTKLALSVGSAIEYFMKRRSKIESEVRRTKDEPRFMAKINKVLFTYLNKPEKILSDAYIRRIVKWARWFLGDPDVAVRSMYRADEIAFMTLFSFRDIVDAVPGNIAGRLENAGYNTKADPVGARREAVAALKELLDCYEKSPHTPLFQRGELDVSPLLQRGARGDLEYALKQIRRLVEWNSDALSDDKKSGGGGENSGNGAFPVSQDDGAASSSEDGPVNESVMPYFSATSNLRDDAPISGFVHSNETSFISDSQNPHSTYDHGATSEYGTSLTHGQGIIYNPALQPYNGAMIYMNPAFVTTPTMSMMVGR